MLHLKQKYPSISKKKKARNGPAELKPEEKNLCKKDKKF